MEVADRQTILSPGDMLGCYRIENFLGQGGFGVTYLAHDTMLDMQVAIKEYLPERIAERVSDTTVRVRREGDRAIFRRGLARFMKEAKTLARFKHPNIVRVMSVFELNGTAYMVMEYERGHDLKQLFHHRECVSENDLKAIIGPVLNGLEEVHRHGFIHRDIKPANILVREDGTPVLLDFGSARLAVGNDTNTMTAMVSVGYAPLEQYSGLDDQQGPWTDIYALGAVLYSAVTGEAPLDSTLRGAAVLNDETDPLIPLTRLAPEGYSAAFCRGVDWALQFKVSSRPQTLAQWRARMCDSQTGLAEPIARLLQTDFEPLPRIPQARDISSAEALTVIKDPSRQQSAQPVSDDNHYHEPRDIETANTVLIEPNWDITDITDVKHNQAAGQGRRIGRNLPILLFAGGLTALAGLILFKFWEAPERAVSASVATASQVGDQAVSITTSVNTEEVTGQEVSTENPLAPQIGSDVAQEITGDAQPSSAPSGTPHESVSGAQGVGSSPIGQTFAVKSPDIAQAERDARLEVDRAVQRAEALRQLQLQELQEKKLAEAEQAEAARLARERKAELARQEARRRSADRAAERNAIRPALTDADIAAVLRQFNALSSAVRARDGEAVREITVPSDRKNAYFDYVFRTFDTVEVRVSNISASRQDQTVRGTLTVKRLIRSNGDIAIPPEEFKNISIYSVKERQWSAIHW